jgi:hypothetical protein
MLKCSQQLTCVPRYQSEIVFETYHQRCLFGGVTFVPLFTSAAHVIHGKPKTAQSGSYSHTIRILKPSQPAPKYSYRRERL